MAEITKLTNLVNPQVMGDWVTEHLEKNMKFASLCTVDTTLAGRALVIPSPSPNTPILATPVR